MDIEKLFLEYWTQLVQLAAVHTPKILLALGVLVVGFWLIGRFKKITQNLLEKANVDITIRPFLSKVLSIALRIALLLSVARMIGVETTSFLALLGTLGLAIGLALQGSLSNFAGGVLILLLRPFKVGDFIEIQLGQLGTVRAIQLFHTHIQMPDNRIIIIPNGSLSNGSIINYSRGGTRRVDLRYRVSYGDDIKKVKEILRNIVSQHPKVLPEPQPTIALMEFGESSMNFVVRPWCKSEDYWTVYFEINEMVKEAFDAQGVTIPLPQRDVHLYQKSK